MSNKINTTKGLQRAAKQLKFIAEGAKELHARNNSTTSKDGINLFSFIVALRVNNIRFLDLNISEFTALSDRSSKNYALLIISLYITGNASRSQVIRNFGLCLPSSKKILDRMIIAGYIEVIKSKTLKNWAGRHFYKEVDHLQLTSKGYDLANHIASLLIDDRLI